jgi:hypothetical protein
MLEAFLNLPFRRKPSWPCFVLWPGCSADAVACVEVNTPLTLFFWDELDSVIIHKDVCGASLRVVCGYCNFQKLNS